MWAALWSWTRTATAATALPGAGSELSVVGHFALGLSSLAWPSCSLSSPSIQGSRA